MIRTRALVDREVREQYTVVVVAQDLGRPPQLASRLLTINITDIDDNPPVFVRLPVRQLTWPWHNLASYSLVLIRKHMFSVLYGRQCLKSSLGN